MNKPKLPNEVDQVLVSKHHILSKGGSWCFPERTAGFLQVHMGLCGIAVSMVDEGLLKRGYTE